MKKIYQSQSQQKIEQKELSPDSNLPEKLRTEEASSGKDARQKVASSSETPTKEYLVLAHLSSCGQIVAS